MSFIRHSFSRTVGRQHLRPGSLGLQSSRPNLNRRCFATDKPSGQASSSRWLLVAIALGLPISFYLWQRGDVKSPAAVTQTVPRGANQEYIQGAEGNENGEQNVDPRSITHEEEQPGVTPPEKIETMSPKQLGLSNTQAMNPFLTRPGLSQKGEGDPDSVKIKGTIKVDRPQE